ncbi:MAG TPA: O-antigen ligase family protein [Candidatus Acidoferrales bacterium]|nr:O-antigen ligase family protein [Candidatus Acidoferrales bacterium]
MIRTLMRPRPLVTIGMLAVGAVAALGVVALSGTKTGLALALAAVLGPIGLYFAICEPLVFPFALYVLLVPFDNLLSIPAFGTLTRALAILSGGAIALWLLRTRRAISPGRPLVFWGFFVVWAATTLCWAIDPQVGYAHAFTLAQLLALYAIVSFVPVDRRTLGILLFAVVFSGVLAAGYGAYIFHNGAGHIVSGRLLLSNNNDVIDPNQFAASLILPIAVALVAALRSRAATVRIGALLALAIMGGGLAIAGSRGGLVAVAIAVMYIVWRTRTAVLAAGFAFAALCSALALDSTVLARFATAASSGGAGRVDIWEVGLHAFRSFMWFGAGLGNFPVAFDRSFLAVHQNYYNPWNSAPHDILLSAGVELGFFGLALLLGAWWFQFRELRSVEPHDELFGFAAAVESAVLGLFVAALFLDIMEMKYTWLAFMVAMLVRNACAARGKVKICGEATSPTAARNFRTTS